jgi:hypothetical protein
MRFPEARGDERHGGNAGQQQHERQAPRERDAGSNGFVAKVLAPVSEQGDADGEKRGHEQPLFLDRGTGLGWDLEAGGVVTGVAEVKQGYRLSGRIFHGHTYSPRLRTPLVPEPL